MTTYTTSDFDFNAVHINPNAVPYDKPELIRGMEQTQRDLLELDIHEYHAKKGISP
jgi:hypothetical protein